MFQLPALPRISFVGTKSLQTLDLATCGSEIKALAESLAGCTAENAVVGLIFPTGPELVIAWLAALAAGRTPLILQYPNDKISKSYWKDSIRDTLQRAGVHALVCSPDLGIYQLNDLIPSFAFERDAAPATEPVELVFPTTGAILQLSSGTTGFKKPIAFSFDALRRHAELYNQVLQLTAEDRIVSWLPLYHDMGFIACFVMPLLLGVPIVMIDPMTWVKQPQLLFDAIQQHHGSICFMPNFGFEVMAKLPPAGPFPTMRHWVSCSEPTYPETLKRFLQSTGASSATVSTCYGMAENVFAVAQSHGMRLVEREGKQHVSCGPPIPGTELKIVEGELYVRSPHSLQHYEGGDDIRDAEGFYPTGDTGFLHEGEVVVTGRKQDLVNIGGRKYLLNDLDFTLAGIFPQSAGRIASLATFDATSGTEKAIFLVEMERFWELPSSLEALSLVREATGIEWLEVHFVPRQFLTKTSSGKINRKQTLQDWKAVRAAAHGGSSAGETPAREARDFAQELARTFPGLRLHRSAEEDLDSLGQLMLHMLCEEHGIAYLPNVPLQSLVERAKTPQTATKGEVFSIVALTDGWRMGFRAAKPHLDEAFLNAISAVVGCPVHIEHLCVPPAPILLCDLIFHDYFLPKSPSEAYEPFSSIVRKIKNASLILIDDEDNFRTPPFCVYPVLNHRFTMHPEADLLGHRLQRYTQNHHLLPRDIVLGREIFPENINPTLRSLEAYLGVPLFRMAFHAHFREYTSEWEFCAYRDFVEDNDKISNTDWVDSFRQVLVRFLQQREGPWRKQTGAAQNRMLVLDTPHFCSFLLNRMAVDFVTRLYNSFCIIGKPSSLPYLQQRLESLGKPYFFSTETEPLRDDFECLLLTGGMGDRLPDTTKPCFDFVHSRPEGTGGGRPYNVPPEIDYVCPPLAACDEALFRTLRPQHGVAIGNYLLNHVGNKK